MTEASIPGTLRIAVPNKGSLSQPAIDILRESGYRQRVDSKELRLIDAENQVEFFYLRPRDIAVYVGEGTLDAGFTGRDLLIDSAADAEEVRPLGFGASNFHFAGPIGEFTDVEQLAGKRIATSYRGMVQRWLDERGISATVTKLDGAVESSIQLGVADAIADVVETGTTLRRAGLEAFGEPLMRSESVLIQRAGAQLGSQFDTFQRRIEGVLRARSYVMMDYDVPDELLETATALTPGIESPTVAPLQKQGWMAVRTMIPRAGAQRLMDELYEAGARGILVTDIHACRL